jgi:Protein of unknown function (DUF4197)
MLRGMKKAALLLVALTLACLTPPSESTDSSGLKEALRVATERAVQSTSRTDGFLGNPRIRIGLPGALGTMANALRTIGMAAQLDELELAMNRAAEKAAGEATPIFVDAIRQMSFSDAAGIVRGGDTAATDYFERTTSEPLRLRFRPIAEQAMQNVGLAQQYERLISRYSAIPFASKPKLDLPGYVTERTLAGLFRSIGDEEKKIRRNPAARSTALLQQVFGR